ncbi:uncharacterized protein LOC142144277 isoform X1 [Mixophyes fleayi]|uniref:uncharacterized protein LOC142144277 isoform X1 n=1 Tax=Mixophyes fleayi TaxID=3061075 RepID=UPI003F4E33C3
MFLDSLLLPAGNWKIKHKRSHLCYERQKKLLKRHLYRQHQKIAPGYMETIIWPRGVKLPKRVEGRPSEDSPETELLHYIETLCDQPEFMSQVEEIIHPALLDTILSPDIDMDFQTLIDELQQEEDVLPMEVEEIIHPALLDTVLSPDIDMDFQTLIDELEEEEDVLPMEVEENIKPAFLDTDLFLDTYEDFHSLKYEPERVDKLLPLEFMEIRENHSKVNKPIVLPEENDGPSSKFTSNSNKTNQTIPDMKILEMPNYTAGTRKTKEFPKSTQSRGYTIINDVIVIDDD